MKALISGLAYYAFFAAAGSGIAFVLIQLGISGWPQVFLRSPMFGQNVWQRQAFWFHAALYLGAIAGTWVAWRLLRWCRRGFDGD